MIQSSLMFYALQAVRPAVSGEITDVQTELPRDGSELAQPGHGDEKDISENTDQVKKDRATAAAELEENTEISVDTNDILEQSSNMSLVSLLMGNPVNM